MVNFCPLLDYAAEVSEGRQFLLLDVGCAGGIDRRWLRMGRRLRAIGVDPNAEEIRRLTGRETNSNVTYLNAVAAIDPSHPFAAKKRGQPDLQRNSWPRTSAKRYIEIVHPELERASALSAPSIVLPEYLQKNGVTSLDFLKIDIDGKDFDVLNAFDQSLEELSVLAVGVEVNFCGSDSETDNTFHNMDRFLKARGFELLALSTRRYSVRALPSRFLDSAGPTENGRVLQGDALYARDLASGLYDDLANSLGPERLLNLMAILAVFRLPDCAAELALKFRKTLASKFDVDKMLDLLAGQEEGAMSGSAGYRRHVDRFEHDPKSFLGTKNPAVQLKRALKKGYLKWRGSTQLAALTRRKK